MGDNRDNSADSRDWGFVDSATVTGRAYLIYWSWDHREGIRWGRIGRRLDGWLCSKMRSSCSEGATAGVQAGS
jgi:hypothetical protein